MNRERGGGSSAAELSVSRKEDHRHQNGHNGNGKQNGFDPSLIGPTMEVLYKARVQQLEALAISVELPLFAREEVRDRLETIKADQVARGMTKSSASDE